MNSLSWFLYLSEICDRASFIFGMTSLVGSFAAAWAAGYTVCERRKAPTFLFWAAPLLATLALSAFLLPSKNTMLAIAASEFGEKIAATNDAKEIASDAKQAVRSWIKKQIEPESKSVK